MIKKRNENKKVDAEKMQDHAEVYIQKKRLAIKPWKPMYPFAFLNCRYGSFCTDAGEKCKTCKYNRKKSYYEPIKEK